MRRAWYRSPVFWFALPGFVFLVWAWIDSMQRTTVVQGSIAGVPVQLDNRSGAMGADWDKPYLGKSAKWALEVRPASLRLEGRWFPLPSHISPHNMVNAVGHSVDIPHWLLLLAYTGLWQLPWLGRYYRRKRIAGMG